MTIKKKILLNIEVVSASQWSLLLTTVSIYVNLFKCLCVKIRLYHILKFESTNSRVLQGEATSLNINVIIFEL